eukprot:SAG22_NODE_13309_length_411_cov_0.637821_1_plen_43_part_10
MVPPFLKKTAGSAGLDGRTTATRTGTTTMFSRSGRARQCRRGL